MDVWQWYVRRGRISRANYVLQYFLPGVLASIAAEWTDRARDLPQVAMVAENGMFLLEPAGLLRQLVFIVLFVPGVTAVVGRLHDCDKSAWWLLLGLIPFHIGTLLLLAVSLFFPGDRLPNRYGPPPAPVRRPRLPAALRRGVPA